MIRTILIATGMILVAAAITQAAWFLGEALRML